MITIDNYLTLSVPGGDRCNPPLRFFQPCFQTVRNTVLPFGTMYFTSKPDSFAKFEKYWTVRGGNSIHQKRYMGSDRTTFTFRPLKHSFICIYVRFFALERCELLFPFRICKFYQNLVNIFGVMAPFVLFLSKKWTNDVMVTSYIIIYFFFTIYYNSTHQYLSINTLFNDFGPKIRKISAFFNVFSTRHHEMSMTSL